MIRNAASGRLGPEVAADVAHALRGPFSAALPALDMLRSGLLGELTDVQLDALRTAERAVCRAFADSSDLAALLTVALSRSELRRTPTLVAGLLADAVELAGLEGSVVVRTTSDPDVPPVLVDRDLTAALCAVLVRRSAAAPERDAALPEPDDLRPPSAEPAVLDVVARLQRSVPARVSISLSRVGERFQPLAGVPEPEPGSEPQSAPLVLVRALVVAQEGRLRSEAGATTVWLPVAPTSG